MLFRSRAVDSRRSLFRRLLTLWAIGLAIGVNCGLFTLVDALAFKRASLHRTFQQVCHRLAGNLYQASKRLIQLKNQKNCARN